MLLVSGVVKIRHVATILMILGPMAAFFGTMQTFSAILRSVTIIFGPGVILSAILGSVTTLFRPGVTLSAILGSVSTFYRPLVTFSAILGSVLTFFGSVLTFYRPLVTFLAILGSVPLLPSPCFVAVPLYSDPAMDILCLDPSFHILTALFKWKSVVLRSVHFDLCK